MYRENVKLAPFTTFRIGGMARLFAEPATVGELAEVLASATRSGLAVHVLGGGSNLLVGDAGVDGLVIHIAGREDFGGITPLADVDGGWRIGAGVPLPVLVTKMAENGMAGIEDLAGIPGSIGGALAMNAGTQSIGFGNVVRKALVAYPSGEFRELGQGELSFGYRRSGLGSAIAVWVEVFFEKRGTPGELLERIRCRKESKTSDQPIGMASAGCIFKNPDARSAGWLLDRAGCKGMAEGGAEVSPIHANFVVNRGGASSRDIAALIGRMRAAARANFGIDLELEIKTWGLGPEEHERMAGRNND